MKILSPMLKVAITLILIFQIALPALCLVASTSATPQNPLIVSPGAVTLEIGKDAPLTAKSGNDDIALNDAEMVPTPSDLLDWDKVNSKLKPLVKYLAADERRTIKFKKVTHQQSNDVMVTVKANLKSLALTVDGQEGAIQPQATVTMSARETRTISVDARQADGSALPDSVRFKLEDSNVEAVTSNRTLTFDGLKITATDVSRDTEVQVRLLAGDQKFPLFRFKIRILARATSIDFAPRPSPQVFENSDSPSFQVILRSNGIQLPYVKGREVQATPKSQKILVLQDGNSFTIRGLPWPRPEAGQPQGSSENTTITFKVVQNSGPEVKEDISVEIIKREGFITFMPPVVEPLLPNGKITTIAQVRERDGTVGWAMVHFDLNNRADEKWVTLAPEGNQLTVHWRNPSQSEQEIRDGDGNKTQLQRPAQVEIKASALISNQPIEAMLTVRLEQVADFVPLKVKLNVMDEKMASNLYGSVTAKENYVLTVRLFNNLKEDKSKQTLGSSLLAYCASVEIAVGLEKRFNPKLKSALPLVLSKSEAETLASTRNTKIKTAAEAQVNDDLDKLKEFQQRVKEVLDKLSKAEADALADAQLVERLRYEQLTNLDPALAAMLKSAERKALESRQRADQASKDLAAIKKELLRSADSRAAVYQLLTEMTDHGVPVDDGQWHPLRLDDLHRIAETFDAAPLPSRQVLSQSRDGSEPPCVGVITYRPYTFEMMVNTVDRRDERSVRSIIFKILSGFGTAASLATAIPGIKTTATGELTDSGLANFQLFLDKYTNLLLPAAERLFPSLKETHRQNIVAQAMKPIEEIPFGSDITRVLFIPKKEIHGLVRGHDVRISEICPFYFSIEVAVVQKGGVVQKGAATP